jgi:hypothetical protein
VTSGKKPANWLRTMFESSVATAICTGYHQGCR